MASREQMLQAPYETREAWLLRLRDQGLKEAKRNSPQTQDTTSANTLKSQLSVLDREYAQYYVKLGNDLKSGKLTQAQYQSEFEGYHSRYLAARTKLELQYKTGNIKKESPPAEAAIADKPTSTTPDVISVKPIPNRLHQYPNYIYGLSLHLLSDKQYNEVVKNQTYTPTNVLVASAGRYNATTFIRNKFFNEDFYFENLNITTVIAPNDVSRNTNAIESSFTLIEPYGFTFIERLLKAADDIKNKNYLDMPYLLQIDFFAMNDAGEIVGSIEELRKRIPVKLIKIDVRVSGKGAEYQIKAIPFNHSAYDSTSVTSPANFEIVASSVAAFFQSVEGTEADPAFRGNQVPGERAISQEVKGPNFTVGKDGTPNGNTVYNRVKSYGTAINSYYKRLREDNKIGSNDVYRFEFDEVIGKSLFVHTESNTPKRTPFKDKSTSDMVTMKRADLGGGQNTYDPTKVIFQINYGTTIEKLIEYIVRNSDYIQNQLIVPEDANYEAKKKELENQPLNWFKIVPTVRLIEFDDVRKIWSREITYQVQTYKMYNIRSDVGPQGVQLYPVKEHNYIYTGKNDDVLDFDIAFNALYYNQTTAYRDNLAEITPTAVSSTTDNQHQNFPNYSGGENTKSLEYNAVMPMVMKPIVQNSKAVATGGPTTAKQVASYDMADSLMTNSEADMLNLKLKILGDPDYIKQDDVFYRPLLGGGIVPSIKPSSDPRLLPNNGSLVMDGGGLYVQVLFRTPIDINESTGLMEFDKNYKHSVFSGMYMVIKVNNSFSGGMFQQELDMVRLPRQQAFDYVNGQSKKSDNRQDLNKNNIPAVPGVLDTAPVIPSLLVGGGSSPSTTPAEQTIEQKPGQSQPAALAATTTPLLLTQNAKDLRIIRETANELTITNQTEPQAIIPDFKPISIRGNRVPGDAAII